MRSLRRSQRGRPYPRPCLWFWATTQALLRHLGPQEIHCVDRAAAMVAVARAIEDPRVTHEVCAAEELHLQHTDFDTVVCNAAFWHFQAIHWRRWQATSTEWVTLFTVPANCNGVAVEGHPLQAAITRVLTESHSDLPPVSRTSARRLDAEAASIGFEPGQWTLWSTKALKRSLSLCENSAMSDGFSERNRQQRDALINQAAVTDQRAGYSGLVCGVFAASLTQTEQS